MSRITGREAQSLVEAYQSIYNIQDQVSEDDLAVEIFEEVAYALISQGHTAVDVLEYFANVDEEVIIEDLIALSEGTFIVEEVVSEEYIEEQMQQLYENPLLGLAARGAGLIAKAAPRIAGTVTKVGQRASNLAWKGGSKATPMGRFPAGTATAPGTKIIGQKNLLQRAGSALSGAVGKVKDVAKGALNKLPGGSGGKLVSAGKFLGKAALGGAAFEAGMRGARALMGDGDKGPAAKTTPTGDKAKFNASAALGGKTAFQAGGGAAAMKKNPKLSAADVQKSGTAALRASAGGDLGKGVKLFKAKQEIMAGKPVSTAPKPKPAPAAPSVPSGSAGGGGSAAPAPAAKAKPTPAPTKPIEVDKKPSISRDVEDIKQMQQRSKQRQGELMGGPEGPGQINKASVEADIKAAQEREKKKAQPVNASYEYDAYDLVLEYLLDNGHAETVDEAHYIMLEMDVQMVGDIVEETLQEKLKPGTKRVQFSTGKDDKFNQAMTERNPRTGRQRATSPELKAMGAHGRAKSAQYDAENRGDTEAARRHETRRGKIAHTVYRKTGRIIDRADND